MSYKWILIVVVPLIAFLVGTLHGMYPSQPFGRDRVREVINGEFTEALLRK